MKKKLITTYKNSISTNKISYGTFNIYYYRCYCNSIKKSSTSKKINVTGTVAPMSVYEAIIKVEIVRYNTGNVDNYYIADEYNNSSSNNPLKVDKTYNLAIIPHKTSKDIEHITFYGSYKDDARLFV